MCWSRCHMNRDQRLRPELIDDAAVQRAADDLLGHAAVAEELASLVQQVPTPSNIALFGPWGSGKTGIGHLLKAALPSARRRIKFVRFDAYKWPETPLRRRFLESISSQIDAGAAKLVRSSYQSTTTNAMT